MISSRFTFLPVISGFRQYPLAGIQLPLVLALFIAGLAVAASGAATIPTARLAAEEKALMPVVVPAGASEQVRAAAQSLADYLGRISGAKFVIETGDGGSGIAVGGAADFPAIKLAQNFSANDGARHEEYLLRSHGKGLWLVGASGLAVQHAVWDLLHRLGYRQFFPGKTWEVVPKSAALGIAVDAFERPAFHSRRIWYGFGSWEHAKAPYADWCAKNRNVQGIELNSGHAYDAIVARNKAAFAAHPEYLGLVNGERRSTKFCIANDGLRKLVAADALAQLAANPGRQSVTIDPSDGGGWCECAECARLGSITDRAITLANEVAESVTARHPDKYVGMYAYNQHSPPPAITAHPRVVISVATAFIKGGYTADQLLEGWSRKASMLGIREYYSVNTWDRDLPGAARGGNIEYLKTTIPHFHEKSARFLSAESSDNWGPNGLGYYLAARMLWDVRAAGRTGALVADFFEQCFGAAREPMRKFYQLLDSGQKQPLSDDLIGRLYRLLDEARGQENDGAVRARLDDLTLYARYVELWLDYSIAKGTARQTAFETLIRHAYRMKGAMMIHSYALYRDLHGRDKSVSIPDDAKFNVPEGRNPWKSSEPFAREELDRFTRDGIAQRRLLDFAPVGFSSELVRPVALQLSKVKTGSMGLYSRAPRTWFTWVDQAPAVLPLTVTAGMIYTTSGVTKLDLYPLAEAEGKSVADTEVNPDKTAHRVELATTFTGLHRLEVRGGGGAQTMWTEGTPMTIESSSERPGSFYGRWTLYFYVPRGTQRVGGFSDGPGILRDGSGREAWKFDNKPGYFSAPVPAGEDGTLWKFEQCAGDKRLMTVPPFLARNSEELLLPREVVEKDALR